MKKIILPVMLAALCGFTGCFPLSLNPLYTDSDLAFDPTLVGVWRGREHTNETWNFTKGDQKEYKLLYTDEEGKAAQFEAHLLKLGDALFLDFYPADVPWEDSRSAVLEYHFIPVHSFAKLSKSVSAPELAFLNPKWLGNLLEKNSEAIRHEMVGDSGKKDGVIVMTASTKELQSFVLKHLNDKDAFLEPIALKRKQGDPKKE